MFLTRVVYAIHSRSTLYHMNRGQTPRHTTVPGFLYSTARKPRKNADGTTNTYVSKLLSRFLLGLFNGTFVAAKAFVSEVCAKEHQAVGMGFVMGELPCPHRMRIDSAQGVSDEPIRPPTATRAWRARNVSSTTRCVQQKCEDGLMKDGPIRRT